LSDASLNDAVFSESSAAIRPWPHSTCAQNRLLNVCSVTSDDSALLIVAHGSTVNPDSSTPTLAHAAEIWRRKFLQRWSALFGKRTPICATRSFCSISNQVVKLTPARISSMKVFRERKSVLGSNRHRLQQMAHTIDRVQVNVVRPAAHQLFTYQTYRIVLPGGH